MNERRSSPADSIAPDTSIAMLLLALPPGRRAAVLQSAVSNRPCRDLDASFAIGPFCAAFYKYWESRLGRVPAVDLLRKVLDPPVPVKLVMEFSRLAFARDPTEMDSALRSLTTYLAASVEAIGASAQMQLFGGRIAPAPLGPVKRFPSCGAVASLRELAAAGRKFPTVHADPPWPYDNEASRAAAVNHYPVMTLDAICAEPVRDLADDNAHLHLWTTNAFLHEAFDVIAAWGFEFKSCLVWIKHELGMGNYWRVSHEFLMLGVRGQLTFRDRTLPSWIQAHRTLHSRKPGIVWALVEKVSRGPYLELYGREELPNSAWTVYGNQIDKRAF